MIARSYPGSVGLHLNEDIAVYEPVDADIRPVAAGTTAAKLLVTNVINHSIPLIRYELDDELTVLAEPNPGPWTGRRIADIEGRVEGTFVYDGDVEIHLHLFRSALGRRRQVLEYQVRQTPAGADIAVRTSARLDTDALSRELVDSSHGARCRPPSGERRRGGGHRAHRIDGKASSLHPARPPAILTRGKSRRPTAALAAWSSPAISLRECSFARSVQAACAVCNCCFAMNGAFCEFVATRFVAGDLDEGRRRGSHRFPRKQANAEAARSYFSGKVAVRGGA